MKIDNKVDNFNIKNLDIEKLKVDNPDITDLELILAYKNGSDNAVNILLERYKNYIFNLSYRFMSNHEDALDLMQEVLIRICRGLKNYEERNYLKGWIYRIVNNTAINMYKKASNKESLFIENLEILDDDRYNPEGGYERIYLRDKIAEAASNLKGKQKGSFFLRYYEGYSYEEIGKILKISSDSAKSNYFYALKKMQIFMENERTML